MIDCDLNTPAVPFLEMWAFRVTIAGQEIPGTSIRDRVLAHVREVPGTSESVMEGEEIRKAIHEIVADRLSCPDFRFFVTDVEEHYGSWVIAFTVVAALYGGV